MTRKNVNTLIQQKMDGLLSQAEREHLDGLLKTGTRAKKLQEQLVQTVDLLERMPEVKPPRTMKKEIMAELRKRHSPAATPLLTQLRVLLNPKPKFAFAYGLALGVFCVGMTVFLFRGDVFVDGQFLRGTLAQNGSLQRVSFTANKIRGTVGVNRSNDVIGMQFVLQTDENIDLLLEYDSEIFKFQKFIMTESSPLRIERGDQYIRTLSKGNQDFLLEFRQGAQSNRPFRLVISSDGIVRYQKDFLINEPANRQLY
jgi:hypothetical protein